MQNAQDEDVLRICTEYGRSPESVCMRLRRSKRSYRRCTRARDGGRWVVFGSSLECSMHALKKVYAYFRKRREQQRKNKKTNKPVRKWMPREKVRQVRWINYVMSVLANDWVLAVCNEACREFFCFVVEEGKRRSRMFRARMVHIGFRSSDLLWI